MKKRDLTALAMIGITAGLAMTTGCQKQDKKSSDGKEMTAEKMSPEMQSFHNSLSPDAQKKFMELDAQHKMMAMEMANQSCNGRNACAGMGGCATASHSCAGLNSCKGQGGRPVRDADKSVGIQHNMQANERHSNETPVKGSNSNGIKKCS